MPMFARFNIAVAPLGCGDSELRFGAGLGSGRNHHQGIVEEACGSNSANPLLQPPHHVPSPRECAQTCQYEHARP